MELAETVTFAGTGRDRAGAERADPLAVARLLAEPAARALPLWRGKPLYTGAGHGRLGWLSPDHAVFAQRRETEVFLGQSADGPRFAIDITPWQPADADAEQARAFFDPTEQHHPALPEDWCFAELRSGMAALSAEDAELAATARALLGWHASHGFCAACGAASQPSMAGWQRDCPDCGTKHFPRTDPVVIMLVTEGNSVLLGRSPQWPERMYSLLAGFVEPGETVEAAVRREVAEETGVRVGRVGYLASQPWPYPSSLMIGCQADAETRALRIDHAELADARWFTREDLARIFTGEDATVAPARPGSIARFLLWHWLSGRLW